MSSAKVAPSTAIGETAHVPTVIFLDNFLTPRTTYVTCQSSKYSIVETTRTVFRI